MQIALYVRVSTHRQQQAQTIEQQLARLQEYTATQPSWQLHEQHICRDDGYSGANLNRPGLDRLRDHALLAAFEVVLLTAPDRLARKYVHQILLVEELQQRGCAVIFVDRPMRDDPHDQRLLQVRGAVAEYERQLITDRMRRGRLAKLRSGHLLPWSRAPYGYLLAPEHPRAPQGLTINPVTAASVQQIFAWYTDPRLHLTLYGIAKRLNADHIPTPRGGALWAISTLRGMLRSTVYGGTAYSERTQFIPARNRASRTRPVGGGHGSVPAPVEEWVAGAVPASIAQATFDAAHLRLAEHQRLSPRNNTAHAYLLRGLVNCGTCLFACMARTVSTYADYACQGRRDALRATTGERCTARAARASLLDTVVWEDLCQILREPGMITHELTRARGGAWLPQALQARRKTVTDARNHVRRHQERVLDVYLAEVIEREEFERKRQELVRTQEGLSRQLRQLEAQVQDQMDMASLAEGIEAFCERVRQTLDQLTFAQRRQLVELLIDCVIVRDRTVEIRYVMPTSQTGEGTPFCRLRSDHIRLINAPRDADCVAMPAGGCLEERQEALDPPIHGAALDNQTTFSKPLDHIGRA
ncbi:MAG TPA: recombinase family protein [Herpetosiphonaceae bacterium]|nr:recombinase family protein [Herpetosiphonaceae bacterium]